MKALVSSLCTPSTIVTTLATTPPVYFFTPTFPVPRLKPPSHRAYFAVKSISKNNSFRSTEFDRTPEISQNQQRPRTLYPGGFKRPEIKVPNVVLQLEPDEVLAGADVLDLIDEAVAKFVGIVVLNGGEAGGKRVYEAACTLKSLVRDRAYFLIAERVDIAAAVNATGVVLSDQGHNMVYNFLAGTKFGSDIDYWQFWFD